MLPGNILIRFCIGSMVFFHSDLDRKSRMTGDCHVRFCERFRGETPLYLLDFYISIDIFTFPPSPFSTMSNNVFNVRLLPLFSIREM